MFTVQLVDNVIQPDKPCNLQGASPRLRYAEFWNGSFRVEQPEIFYNKDSPKSISSFFTKAGYCHIPPSSGISKNAIARTEPRSSNIAQAVKRAGHKLTEQAQALVPPSRLVSNCNSTVVFLRFWDTCDTIVTISCCQVKV
jgi:hypothetical protein